MPYKDPVVRRAKQRIYDKRYRERERAKVAAYGKAYKAAHREKIRKQKRARYWADPEKARAKGREKYAANREKRIKKVAEWQRNNPEKVQAYSKRTRANLRRKMAEDSDRYAMERAKERMRSARRSIKKGIRYRPRFFLRIPDWATFGQRILDTRSAFLAVNMTPSQRAYARELAIERSAR